jgi:hypothetical protein
MKRIILAAVAAVAFTTSAFAGDEVMATRFGNTTKVTYPNGQVVKVWYNADHTWSGDANGTAINGTWKLEGDKICVTTANPPADMANMPNPQCNPVVARKVGESWTIGEGAQQIKVELLAGKQ